MLFPKSHSFASPSPRVKQEKLAYKFSSDSHTPPQLWSEMRPEDSVSNDLRFVPLCSIIYSRMNYNDNMEPRSPITQRKIDDLETLNISNPLIKTVNETRDDILNNDFIFDEDDFGHLSFSDLDDQIPLIRSSLEQSAKYKSEANAAFEKKLYGKAIELYTLALSYNPNDAIAFCKVSFT